MRFHSANADLFYVYTMAVQDGVPRFVLDTAASSDLRTEHKLRASGYMQPFELRHEYEDGWLDQIASGKTYVTPRDALAAVDRRSSTPPHHRLSPTDGVVTNLQLTLG